MGLIERAWLLDLRTTEDDGFMWVDNAADAAEAESEGVRVEEVVPAQQLQGAVSAIGELQDALADALSGNQERIDRAHEVLAVYEYAATAGGR